MNSLAAWYGGWSKLVQQLGRLLALVCLLAFPDGTRESAAQPPEKRVPHKGIQRSSFGKLPDGTEVELYTLNNSNGLICKVITYGAIITELHVPDRNGKMADIVLGYDTLPQLLQGDVHGA